MRNFWTEEQEQYLLEHAHKKHWTQCAMLFNERFGMDRSPDAIRIKASRLGLRHWRQEVVLDTEPWREFIQDELGEPVPVGIQTEQDQIDTLIDATLPFRDAVCALDARQVEPTVGVPEEGWFGLVLSGDWHLGALGSDLSRLVEDLRFIGSVPRFYYVFCGDASDNFIAGGPHSAGIHEALLTPRVARKVVARLFEYIGDRLLAIATGCHDAWSMDVADYNLMEDIKQAHPKAAYLEFGGSFILKCTGGAEIHVVLRHRGQGSSIYNIFHPCLRELHFQRSDPDLIAIAHTHESGIAVVPALGQMRCLVRTGTYKTYDRYAGKLGYDDSRYHTTIPVVLIHGQSGEFQAVMGIRTAAQMLKVLSSA